MKMMIVLLLIGISLILLLGLAKSDPKPPQLIQSECAAEQYWQRVKGYKVIHEPNLKDLQKEVQNELGHGWYPIGGISIIDSNCCQVMIK